MKEVVRAINDIAETYDLVGLTIAEPMPRIAIKFQEYVKSVTFIKIMKVIEQI